MLLKNGGRRAFNGEQWQMKLSFNGDIKTELMQSYAVGFRHRTTLSPTAALALDFADASGRPIGVFDVGARLDVAAGDRTLVFPSEDFLSRFQVQTSISRRIFRLWTSCCSRTITMIIWT